MTCLTGEGPAKRLGKNFKVGFFVAAGSCFAPLSPALQRIPGLLPSLRKLAVSGGVRQGGEGLKPKAANLKRKKQTLFQLET